MKTTSVSYESVREACNQLFSQGKNASFDLVYDLIGRTGSKEVVTQMIIRWRREVADKQTTRHHPSLPAELVTSIDELAEVLFGKAIDAARLNLDEHYRESLTIRERAESEAEGARHALAVEQSLRKTDQETIARTQEALGGTEARVRELEMVLSASEATNKAAEQRYADLNCRMQALETDAVAERQRHEERFAELSAKHAAEIREASARHDAAIAALHDSHAAQLRADREAMDGERRHLMSQTDEIRRDAGAKEKLLQAQLATANSEIDTLRASLNESATALTAAKEAAAELRGQLAALKTVATQRKQPKKP